MLWVGLWAKCTTRAIFQQMPKYLRKVMLAIVRFNGTLHKRIGDDFEMKSWLITIIKWTLSYKITYLVSIISYLLTAYSFKIRSSMISKVYTYSIQKRVCILYWKWANLKLHGVRSFKNISCIDLFSFF